MRKHWLSTGMLFFLLTACSTSPRPDEAVALDAHHWLGITELSGDDVSVQALVPGLTFTIVERDAIERNGVRIQEMVYEIENTSSQDLNNLTLYPIDTARTLPGTNVSQLRDISGAAITNPDMAPSIIAVHGRDAEDADMQAFTEEDKANIKALLDSRYPSNTFTVLARGFVASNSSSQGERAIASGESGVVTIAVQYPYDSANPAGYPDSFNLTFAFIDEATARVTQGDNEANEAFVERVLGTFDPTPEGLEIVINDPQNPPSFDVPVTVLTSEKPTPPIAHAEALPTSFVLTVASVNATADADIATDITTFISPAVQSVVEVQ